VEVSFCITGIVSTGFTFGALITNWSRNVQRVTLNSESVSTSPDYDAVWLTLV
jgi:hypothetical protein